MSRRMRLRVKPGAVASLSYPAIVVTHGLQTTWDVPTNSGHNPATLTKVWGVDTLPTGAANESGGYLVVNSNNVLLDNWDLTGCLGVEVKGDNCTMTNCYVLPGNDTEAGAFYGLDVTATAQGFVANNCTFDAIHMRVGGFTVMVRVGGVATFNDCVCKNAETKSQGTSTHNRTYFVPGANGYDVHMDVFQPDQGSVTLYQCFFDCRGWDGYGILDHATRNITNVTDAGSSRVRLTFSSSIPSYWIANGDRSLQVQGVGGATQLNANGISTGHFWRIQAVTATTVDLSKVSEAGSLAGIDFSSLSAYTSGGTAQVSPIPFTNYMRMEGSAGAITLVNVNQCICVGFDGVPGSFNPHAITDDIDNVTWTNSLWDLGVTGSYFDTPITPNVPGAITTWSGNYNFDTGDAFPEPT